jgi:hypothetical protein
MRIELWKITRGIPHNFDIGGRIKHILGKPISERARSKGVSDYIRMEEAEHRSGKWLLDFTLTRTQSGPAKVSIDQPATGFQLAPDEGFGEETAFLWDPSNDWCVIQYNHHGARPKSMVEYLGNFDPSNHAELGLIPKLDQQVHSKIMSKKLVTKFTVSVAAQEASDYDYGFGESVNNGISRMKSSTGAERIEFTISASKKRGLDVDLAAFFSRFTRRDTGPINGAHAVIRSTADDEPECIDLLTNRIVKTEDIRSGQDKRYPREARWNALLRAHDGWRNLMTRSN